MNLGAGMGSFGVLLDEEIGLGLWESKKERGLGKKNTFTDEIKPWFHTKFPITGEKKRSCNREISISS